MREPGQILLLSTYELGHQPLALSVPLAFFERAGFRPLARDLSVEPVEDAAVQQARLIALSVPMHTALRLGLGLASRLRALNPTAHIVAFGHYAWLNADLLLRGADPGARPLVDSVLGGECEETLVALAEALESRHAGAGAPPALPSVIAPVLKRLDFPTPARGALQPPERYAHLVWRGATRLGGTLEASRGCKHLCRHCPLPPIYRGRFFIVPEDVVLEDARQQVARGARHLTLSDADFFNGPGHALRVLARLHDEFPEVTYDVTIKVEHLIKHARHLAALGQCGVLFVVSAVESLSDRVLAILDKGHTRADVFAALAAVRAAGMALRPSLLPFTPWSTLEDYLELLEFIAQNQLIDAVDPVHLGIRLLVPPGTLLLEHPQMQPYLGELDEAALSYRWHHPDPRVDALQQEVFTRIAQGALQGEDTRDTFAAVQALAYRHAGQTHVPALPPLPQTRLPRLSEPWFC